MIRAYTGPTLGLHRAYIGTKLGLVRGGDLPFRGFPFRGSSHSAVHKSVSSVTDDI